MEKKAIVVASFGTTYQNALKAIEQIEQAVLSHFPDRDFFRAFTSGMVRKKIAANAGPIILSPAQLFQQLTQQGYQDILCQPTHVIPGIEYEMLLNDALPYHSVTVGEPLLFNQEDYMCCANAVLSFLPPLTDNEALVLMGHGTTHFANAAYSQLEQTFRALGHDSVYVGTVEGFPDFSYVLNRLNRRQIKKVYLLPFMVVAGDHAQNDLAGDQENSWLHMLTSHGYQAEAILRGLGELPQIADLFTNHCQNIQHI